MRRLLACLVCFLAVTLQAQPTNPTAKLLIQPDRRVDWSQAGAPSIDETRTQCGSTIQPYTGDAETINTAIQNCGTDQYVQLAAGTFTLTSMITFQKEFPDLSKSNVTLRGAGPNQTFLVFTADVTGNCRGTWGTLICASSRASNYAGEPNNTATWSAGYTKGTTSVVTLSDVTNLAAGSALVLDQLNDSSDGGGIYICTTQGTCSSEGASNVLRSGRYAAEVVTVASINGSNVTLTTPLSLPIWSAGQTPQAWWSDLYATGLGVEDLSIDGTDRDADGCDNGVGTSNAIVMSNTVDSWVRRVRSTGNGGQRAHVMIITGAQITIRDSYFYENNCHGSVSYGVDVQVGGRILVENNIFQKVTAPIMFNGSGQGSVIGYNYINDATYTTAGGSPSAWMGDGLGHHSAGVSYILHEGNISTAGWHADQVHGPAAMLTAFRNRFIGWETDKTQQTFPVHAQYYSRYLNFIGNVLGKSGYHAQYQCVPAAADTASCGANKDAAIYSLGWSGNESEYNASNGSNDLKVASTAFRWGNYDTVNAAVRWESSEVPTGDAIYPQYVPPSQVLPASLYKSAKPAWWGVLPWPGIGPDVSGGTEANVGGHVYNNPAKQCFDNFSTTDGTGAYVFAPSTCY